MAAAEYPSSQIGLEVCSDRMELTEARELLIRAVLT
jgi:hypothetical protein